MTAFKGIISGIFCIYSTRKIKWRGYYDFFKLLLYCVVFGARLSKSFLIKYRVMKMLQWYNVKCLFSFYHYCPLFASFLNRYFWIFRKKKFLFRIPQVLLNLVIATNFVKVLCYFESYLESAGSERLGTGK